MSNQKIVTCKTCGLKYVSKISSDTLIHKNFHKKIEELNSLFPEISFKSVRLISKQTKQDEYDMILSKDYSVFESGVTQYIKRQYIKYMLDLPKKEYVKAPDFDTYLLDSAESLFQKDFITENVDPEFTEKFIKDQIQLVTV